MCKRIISDYLTEKKLSEEIEVFAKCQNYEFLGKQIRLEGNRKWAFDCGIQIGNRKILIEFDGYSHYTDRLVMYRDFQKDELAHREEYEVVRFPYWVQLTTETLSLFLQIKTKKHIINTEFPHGFISKKAGLPSSFCLEGCYRFLRELDKLPKKIQYSIMASLEYQSIIRKVPFYVVCCTGIRFFHDDIKKRKQYKKAYKQIKEYVENEQ